MKIVPALPPLTFRLLTACVVLSLAAPARAESYVPPAGLGAPARRESAGTRGCTFGNPPNLVALMPSENVGWTTAAYPRFYWYVPVNQASFVRFTLEKSIAGTSDTEMIYQSQFSVLGESGIMSLQLPENANIPPLAVGDRYRWQVAIFCNPTNPNGDLQVDGWVERQVPSADLTKLLNTVADAEKVALYAQNGYWFNAVDQLAALQQDNPADADWVARWTELLDSVGLGAIANQPLMTGE